MRDEEWKQPIPTLDLVEFCRDQDKIETTIVLHWGTMRQFVWIKLAQIRLQNRDNSHFPGVWVLDAYLADRTDFEGDSAFILSFELISVEFEAVRYGTTFATGYINPNRDDRFSVPTENYSPTELNGDAKYVPPDNKELFELVSGKRISIHTGIVHEPEED